MARNKKKSSGGGGGGKQRSRQGGRDSGRGGSTQGAQPGPGCGRGRGGRGRGTGTVMTTQQRPPQCRLFHLYQHLVLRCFNFLDDQDRKNSFVVMGWGAENYEKRKEMFQKQREQMEKMRKQKEEEERLKKGNDEATTTTTTATTTSQAEGDDANDTDKLPKEMGKLNVSKENNDNIAATKSKPAIPLLPPLFARTDPFTLLARLNTRRLHQRLVHYKKEQRKKKELNSNANSQADASDGDEKSGSIMQYYENELKEKMQADRLYPKNVTIEEMADLEWKNLLEMAKMRMSGNDLPYDPIPTQYELLLFSSCPRAVAVLASYPRSGNSLMRTLYEHTTLRVTGSDMQGGLAKHDLVGEMAVGTNQVQFVKTHYPERRGTPPFHASRAVLLVRNPFDAIESFFNLMMTGTHTTSISTEIREKTTQIWEEFVLKEIRVWKKFHLYWLNQDIPLLLIRYEDLIRQPDKCMERVIQFVLEIKCMGSFFGERIDRCIREQEEIERLGSYKPRSGGIGKSFSKYSEKLLKEMQDKEFNMIMEKLGYGNLLKIPNAKWSEMPPLKDYGTEYLTSSFVPEGQQKIVLLNKGDLARGPAEQTNWRKIKVELGIVEQTCNCDKCKNMSKR